MSDIRASAHQLEVMNYLADQVMNRPMMYGLVRSDIHRWEEFTEEERKAALRRAVRRVGAVCPWVRTKPRVVEALAELEEGP